MSLRACFFTAISALCVLQFALCFADSPIPGNFVGGNLTSFENGGGASNNNQYNQMMNPARGPAEGSGGAKADFGNCNALIQRCASPKCGSGCTDMNVAYGIVLGCVQASQECKQHGEALAQAVAAQMVASSTQKANSAANAAAQQQAAAAQQQTAAMQAQMQQMQEQMAAQQAQSAQQMQQALAQQQAATEAALAQQAELLKQQQAAAPAQETPMPAAVQPDPGVSSDMIARQQIVGQVMSSLDGVDASLKSLKQTVQDVLDYAKCDFNATTCEGPKRVSAFKKKAQKFIEPYDNVLDALESAIMTAQASGVDLSDVYMMLSGACNQWGKFLCSKSADVPVRYCSTTNEATVWDESTTKCTNSKTDKNTVQYRNPNCQFTGMVSDKEEIQQNWIAQNDGEDSTKVKLACMSDGILQMGIFKRQNRKKQTSGIDVDLLEYLVNYDEPKSMKQYKDNIGKLCWPNDTETMEKTIRQIRNGTFTYEPPDELTPQKCTDKGQDDGCFGLCSTHAFNIGVSQNPSGEDKTKMKEVIALKATALSQLIKKNYDILDATVKQIKTQMQKATLAAASGKDSDSPSSSVALPSCGMKSDLNQTLYCLEGNLSGMQALAKKSDWQNFRKAAADAKSTINAFKAMTGVSIDTDSCPDSGYNANKATDCLNKINGAMIAMRSNANKKPVGKTISFNIDE